MLLAVAFAFFLPYGAAFLNAFSGEGKITVFENSSLLRITLFTVKQAFLSVLVSLAIGLPGAWLIGTSRRRFTPLLRVFTSIPFAMPSILVVLGFVLFFGNSGWVNRFLTLLFGEGPYLKILYKREAIILAHGFFNFPLVVRLAGDGLAGARAAYGRAASTLGASPLAAALTVILPLSFPAVLSAALLVFLYSFTSFAVVLVLGGGPASTTLAVEIYRHARIFLNYRNAGALAVVETLIAVTVFLTYAALGKKAGEIKTGVEGKSPEKTTSIPLIVFTVAYVFFTALFIFGPIISIALESFLSRQSRSALPVLGFFWW
jgi:thiamine transport system permease protein